MELPLKFRDVERNAEGKLVLISGFIRFPDGASGKFKAESEEKLEVMIMRHKNGSEWEKLHIRVNNGKEIAYPGIRNSRAAKTETR